jgi:small subunit ribosomal protein S7e
MTDDEQSCLGQDVDPEEVQRKINDLDARPIEEFPLFMQDLPQDADANIPLTAIQAMLHEGTPYEQALNFKNQGNECFLLGPSGYVDARTFYTRGLGCGCEDGPLMAILHLNRAATNLGLGNFGDAIRDAQRALELDNTASQIKAHRRILHAAVALRKATVARTSYQKLVELEVRVDEKTVKELNDLETQLEAEEKQRKAQEAELQRIRTVIGSCGVEVVAGVDSTILENFASLTNLPTVHRDRRTKRRLWPILLLYPAVAQSDMLQAVDESSTIEELLQMVFSESPEWDVQGKYRNSRKLRVFWYDDRLVEVKKNRSVGELLGNLITKIERGILPFYVCPEGADSDALIKRFPSLETF